MKLTATFIPEGDMGYTGWINEIAGITAFGETLEKAEEHLKKVLQAKFDAERKRAVELYSHNAKIIQRELTFTEKTLTL